MIFYSKCEKSVQGVLIISPFLSTLVHWCWIKRDVGETVIIFIICFSFILLLFLFVIPRKYIVGTECLQIIRIVGRKEISYNNIDGILRKEGKVSLETPSMQQLWLMKGDRVLAQLSPIKLEECEEEIIRQINIWRIKNQ